MLKVALGDYGDGKSLHVVTPYNGEHVLAISSYHEENGTFKAATISTQAASPVVITDPDLGGAIVLTSFVISGQRKNLGIMTIRWTDGTNTENVFSADLTDAAVNLAATGLVGWRGWVNARLEIVLTGADTPVTVTIGYTKVPEGDDFTTWDAKR